MQPKIFRWYNCRWWWSIPSTFPPGAIKELEVIREVIYQRYQTLREKCPNTELFLVRIFLYLDWIQRFTGWISVFSPNTGKYGPEKTPNLDTFHTVLWNQLIALRDYWRNYINKHKLISWESNSWVFTMVFKDAVHWNISRKYRFKFYPRFAKFHVKVLWEKIKDCSILCTNIF